LLASCPEIGAIADDALALAGRVANDCSGTNRNLLPIEINNDEVGRINRSGDPRPKQFALREVKLGERVDATAEKRFPERFFPEPARRFRVSHQPSKEDQGAIDGTELIELYGSLMGGRRPSANAQQTNEIFKVRSDRPATAFD
jgi:hypothetical protein